MHPLFRLVLSLPPHLKLGLLTLISFISIPLLSSILYFFFVKIYGFQFRKSNERRKRIALNRLGIVDLDEVKRRKVVGFFHPYCNAGGGGERVLWTAVSCLQREDPEWIIVIYTGDLTDENRQGSKEGEEFSTEGKNLIDEERVTKKSMILKVKDRFGIDLNPSTLIFIRLGSRRLIEDSTWPRFTLLGQSLGSIFLAWQGLGTGGLIPDVWIDTMGYAFTYPLIKHLCRIPVGSYTHYPTISTDMLQRVSERKQTHTNTRSIASSTVLTNLKLLYYVLFAEVYSICLRQSTVLMVNSTWTRNHIDHLLKPFGYRDDVELPTSLIAVGEDKGGGDQVDNGSQDTTTTVRRRKASKSSGSEPSPPPSSTRLSEGQTKKSRFRTSDLLYPPCDTESLSTLSVEDRDPFMILSLAQFRPEKDHSLQLRIISDLLQRKPLYRPSLRLIMAGSVRNDSDRQRIETLQSEAKELGFSENVDFLVNASFERLKKDYLGKASVGLHTMVDEHFGITVVEFMAAGLIPLVHASAGPLLDIVTPLKLATSAATSASTNTTAASVHSLITGYHAKTLQEFVDKLDHILQLTTTTTPTSSVPASNLSVTPSSSRTDGKKDSGSIVEFRKRIQRKANEFSGSEFEKGWLRNWEELKGFGGV